MPDRIFLVSNRLPVTIRKGDSSIRIGMNASHARFNLAGVRELRRLLTTLAGESRG